MGAALYEYYVHGELKASGSSITEGIGQATRVPGNLDGAPVDDSTLSVNPANYLEKHLRDVIAMMDGKKWADAIQSLTLKEIHVLLPRFKAEREAGLYTLAALLAKPVERDEDVAEALALLPAGEPFIFFDTDTLVAGPLDRLAVDFSRPTASMRREGT